MPRRSCSCSIVLQLESTSALSGTNPLRSEPSAISKIVRSAPSRISSASWSLSYASATIRLAEAIRCRRVDFSLMIRA